MLLPFVLKSRLESGEALVGSWLSFGYPLIAEMMAHAGFDFLVIDMEHGHAGTAGMLHLIQVIELSGTAPLVRVASNDVRLIKSAMDGGAHGVIVPDIRSAAEAARAVEAVHYPPRGKRGVGLSRAQRFGSQFERYRDECLPQALVVAQIEHHQAVTDLDSILAVDGIDAFIIGPYDMSGSINRPGEFDHPEVAALLERAGASIRTSSKPGGYHIVHTDHALMQRRLAEGCRFIAYGTEMTFLDEKLNAEGAFVRSLKQKTVK
ncbi:MAG: aldolase/citrate lyase family protein [Rhizomicrobium sp.]